MVLKLIIFANKAIFYGRANNTFQWENNKTATIMIHLKALIIVMLIALVFTVILLAVNSYFWLYEKAKSKALKNFLTYFYIFLGAAFIYLYVFIGVCYSD